MLRLIGLFYGMGAVLTFLTVTGSLYGRAFWVGVQDGREQGPELSTGMTYEDGKAQRWYDAGTWVGVALR